MGQTIHSIQRTLLCIYAIMLNRTAVHSVNIWSKIYMITFDYNGKAILEKTDQF